MHRATVFSKEVFSILNHMFSFLCLLFVTTLHITGVSVLIYFKGILFQIPIWKPVHWLLLVPRSTHPGISFKAELQHIFKRFFQFSLLVLASFSLLHILGVRCPTVIYHNAAWCYSHCSFSACRPSHSAVYVNLLHEKSNLQFTVRKSHKYLWYIQYQYSKFFTTGNILYAFSWYRAYNLL